MPDNLHLIPLAVHATPSLPSRRSEPVTLGVPLPKGTVTSAAQVTVHGPDGPKPSDVHVLDRWSDGSARWALVDAQVSTPDAGPWHVRIADEAVAAPASAIAVAERDGTIEVDTGAARFGLDTNGRWPISWVETAAAGRRDLSASGFSIALSDGQRPSISLTDLSIVRRGAVRTVCRSAGIVQLGSGRRVELEWELHFHTGLAVVEAHVTIRNPHRAMHEGGYWELGDAGSLLIEDVSLEIATGAGSESVQVFCSPEEGQPLVPSGRECHLYQDSSGGEHWQSLNHVNREGRVPVTFCGYRQTGDVAREGRRATPIVRVAGGRHVTTVATRHFWQNFPKAIVATVEGVRMGLFPREWSDAHELQGGEQRTHAVAIGFGDEHLGDGTLAWWREPVVVGVAADWIASTGVLPWFTTACPDAASATYRALQDAAVEGDDTFEAKRERLDEYGWRHFGDIYGDHEAVRAEGGAPLVSHYNNQYDPVLGLTLAFLRTGDARWWAAARELTSHVVDIDVYHTSEDKAAYNGGLFWHTVHYIDAGRATHRSYPKAPGSPGGGPASEQNYTSGLMLQYFLTGDSRARDAAVGLAEFVLQIDDGSRTVFRWLARGATGLASASGNELYHGPGRGSGNSVNACLDGFRLTGERRFLDKAEELIRRCVHPAQDIDALTLLDAERRWYYTMFFQSLGKYLDTKMERGELDAMYEYGRRTLVHFARWMAAHERPTLDHPEQLEFPTETWAAQDIRKCDVFNYAALHAEEADVSLFRERARYFFAYATSTLGAMPTRALCRPVVVLLTSGLTHAWFEQNASASAPPPRESSAHSGPVAFVPQKARAMRRARSLAVGGMLIVISLLVAAVITWF